MHLASPAVERAVLAAHAHADRLGIPAAALEHYILALLDEEEGRPAVALGRLGVAAAEVRGRLEAGPTHPAPPVERLFAAAREWSIAHRADPAFLTDAFLLAVLRADPAFAAAAAAAGVDAGRLEVLFRGPAEDAPVADSAPAVFALPDVTDAATAARILDANLNRAREALRVVEDYCRFGLADRVLTEEAKAARHALAEATALIPAPTLLAARDTQHDVGTGVTAGREYERESPAHVAAVNLKRLQEALRSLEEYGKLFAPHVGRSLEAVRYRAYTLERAVRLGGPAREKLAAARVYVLLTGAQCLAGMDWTIAEAAAGGATVFQLREKTLPDRELLARARDVRRWTRAANALFVVNDRPDIARLADADGVHLGQDDMPVHEARRILGPDALIGVSTHSVEQVRQAVRDGASYLGVGPTFPSKTKAFDAFPGLAFVREAAAETSLPAFVLGGVAPSNVGAVAAAGGVRVAASAAVTRADDPRLAARLLREALPS